MTTMLADIHTASDEYLREHVTTSVQGIRPVNGHNINVGERFRFDIRVANAAASSGGVKIKDIIYHVESSDPPRAKLIVPDPMTVGIARDALNGGATLDKGMAVSQYFLTPIPERQTLDVAAALTFPTNLEGTALAAGDAQIKVHVHGKIDRDYLFYSNTNQETAASFRIYE